MRTGRIIANVSCPEIAGITVWEVFMFVRMMVLLVLLGLTFSAGCAKVGSTAGKAQAKIEKGAENMEEGYHEGYAKEKAKP